MDRQQILKPINLLFASLAIGQMIFALVVLVMLTRSRGQDAVSDTWYSWVAPLALLGGVLLSQVVEQQKRSEATQRGAVEDRVEHYRQRIIMRSVLMEGGNLIIIMSALLARQPNFLLLFLAGLAYFLLFLRPREEELHDDYGV